MLVGRGNFVIMTNKDGADRTKGAVVILDSSNDDSFKTTTTASDHRAVGVLYGDIADNATGLVQVGGIVPALVDGAVTRGHYLATGTTAGKLHDTGTAFGATVNAPAGSVALAMQAAGGAGTIDVLWLGVQISTALDLTDKIVVASHASDITGEVLRPQHLNYFLDTYPSSPNAMDDEFDDTSGMSGTGNGLNARWTWRNQGTATGTFGTNGYVKLDFNGAAGAGFRGITQAIPAGDWTVVASISRDNLSTSSANHGIGLVDTVNKDFYSIGFNADDNLGVFKYSDYTAGTFASTVVTHSGFAALTHVYLRVQYVSATTKYTVSFSTDGVGWKVLTSLFSDTVGADAIGVFVGDATLSVSVTYCDFFRRIA